MGIKRHLKEPEKLLIERLLRLGDKAEFIGRLASLEVQEMADGEMGSLYFLHQTKPDQPRRFGKQLSELMLKDVDGVDISVSLNLDEDGELFELDIWKVDFSRTISLEAAAIAKAVPCHYEAREVRFIASLVKQIPSLRPMLEEHLKDQHGEILSHLFFGDVTRYVLALARSDNTSSLNEIRGILQFLEDNYLETNEYSRIRNVIDVSFLEDLQHEGEATLRIVGMLGPKLAKEWQNCGYVS